jgi:hypothetical protein
MQQLPTVATKELCSKILNTLCSHGRKEVRAWAKHKKIPWILSGINRAFSKMDPTLFTSTQRNSNLIESVHHATNTDGIGVALLAGIKQYVLFIGLFPIHLNYINN